MALLNDLKKLLFGAKAVTKSAAEKAADAGKEAAQDLAQSTGELWQTTKHKVGDALDQAADMAEDLGQKTAKAASDAVEKAKEFAADLGDKFMGADTPSKPSDDIMDEILAETRPKPPASEPEETLELPPLPGTPKLAAEEPAKSGDLGDTIAGLGSKVMEKSEQALGKAGEFAEGVGSKVLETGGKLTEKFGEQAEKIGGVILEKSDEVLDKAAGFAEEVGGAILEKTGEAMEKAKGFAENLGEKILKAKDELVAKAEEEAAKSGETTGSLIDQAKGLAQKLEDKIKGKVDFEKDFADTPLDTGGSELEKHGSFWEKAERFAKGDYHNKGDQPKPGELTIQPDPDYQKTDKTGSLKGYDDQDGDGDSLIDDAVIDDEK